MSFVIVSMRRSLYLCVLAVAVAGLFEFVLRHFSYDGYRDRCWTNPTAVRPWAAAARSLTFFVLLLESVCSSERLIV